MQNEATVPKFGLDAIRRTLFTCSLLFAMSFFTLLVLKLPFPFAYGGLYVSLFQYPSWLLCCSQASSATIVRGLIYGIAFLLGLIAAKSLQTPGQAIAISLGISGIIGCTTMCLWLPCRLLGLRYDETPKEPTGFGIRTIFIATTLVAFILFLLSWVTADRFGFSGDDIVGRAKYILSQSLPLHLAAVVQLISSSRGRLWALLGATASGGILAVYVIVLKLGLGWWLSIAPGFMVFGFLFGEFLSGSDDRCIRLSRENQSPFSLSRKRL
ncbi:MAG TPA: hypothetical protein DDW52_27065 [Planctomycetaceae bacterium]|nr:hypothetical protein [Planctomycetaceae bacterium]